MVKNNFLKWEGASDIGWTIQCGENCTGMRAMPVGKLSKTGKIKESYQNIYGQMSINVENPKALISFSWI